MTEHRETSAIQADLINAIRQQAAAHAHMKAVEVDLEKAESDYGDACEATGNLNDELRLAIQHLSRQV